jgi:hypothetical protein
MGNCGDVKVGTWDQVGYVMISVDSTNIIPIARSDEHQMGYEVLRDIYFRKRLVPKETYFPIFAFGQNYLWQETAKEQQEALRRFREYGGRNSVVKGMNTKYIANMDQFISSDGNISVNGRSLSPIGKFIIGKLGSVARGVVSRQRNVFSVAHDFIEWMEANEHVIRQALPLTDGELAHWRSEALRAEAAGDYDKLSAVFFTFSGIKNRFHSRIRSVVTKKGSVFDLADVRDFWGNLKMAMAEFDRLSQI